LAVAERFPCRVYASHPRESGVSPCTTSMNRRCSRRVTGPAFPPPTGVRSTLRTGTTSDAVDAGNGRPVAIKRFDVRGAKSWKDVELAEREARTLSALDHDRLGHPLLDQASESHPADRCQ